jgi:hypothetical protein
MPPFGMRVPTQKAARLSVFERVVPLSCAGNLHVRGLVLEGSQRILPFGASTPTPRPHRMPLYGRRSGRRGQHGHDRATAVYGGLPFDCLAFDEVWRGLLVREAREPQYSRRS